VEYIVYEGVLCFFTYYLFYLLQKTNALPQKLLLYRKRTISQAKRKLYMLSTFYFTNNESLLRNYGFMKSMAYNGQVQTKVTFKQLLLIQFHGVFTKVYDIPKHS